MVLLSLVSCLYLPCFRRGKKGEIPLDFPMFREIFLGRGTRVAEKTAHSTVPFECAKTNSTIQSVSRLPDYVHIINP